jgi:hypothetical protein
MKRKLTISLVAGLLVMVFGGLRVYGAYQSEQDAALARAAKADDQAAKLEAEEQRLDRQNKCNAQWLDYKNALLKKQIAELRGLVGKTPVEPFCTGYAPRLDQSMDLIFKAGEMGLEAISVRGFAKYERQYASSRKLQTQYLRLRLWAFLTGTEVKTQPAKMAQEYEKANNFSRCVKGAKSDQKSFGKLRDLAISLNNHKDAATPEAVCEVLSR